MTDDCRRTEHNRAYSLESFLLGAKITEIPEKVKAADPETFIRQNALSFLLQQGIKDPIRHVQKTVDFSAKLIGKIGKDGDI